MSMQEQIQLFGDKKIRTSWNDEEEKWYFSIIDIIAALTESSDPKQYVKKMRTRDTALDAKWGTICTPVRMLTKDGKHRKTLAADMEGVFRIIQSIPSKKAEPIKEWVAQVASERIDETIDPEIAIQRAIATYRRHGYDATWIKERLEGIKERKALTDEWQRVGVKEDQFGILTNDIYQALADMRAKEWKKHKGLTKENLRDNMTATESVLTRLGEVATRELSQNEDPKTFDHSRDIARRGGGVARAARNELEKQLGHSVISRENAKTLRNAEAPKQIDDQ